MYYNAVYISRFKLTFRSSGATFFVGGCRKWLRSLLVAGRPKPTCHSLRSGPHDAPYFRALLETEAAVLTALCTEWEAKLVDVSLAPLAEDAAERVRAAVGKTRLLCDRKGRMEQFRGLVDACEYRLGDRPTTTEDLQGFWDMVSVQVEDVKRMFEELEQLEKRGWVVPEESTENKYDQNSYCTNVIVTCN